MKTKELYLPVAEAAERCECTERALYQYGAECLLPFYTDLSNYKYINVTEYLREPIGANYVGAMPIGPMKNLYNVELPDDTLMPGWSYEYPLQGRYRIFEWSLDIYLTDPEVAPLVPIRFFGPNGDDDKIWNRKWSFNGGLRIKDSNPYVMTKDLLALGLLPTTEQSSLSDFSDDLRWQQSDLKIAVEAWMAAKEKYGLNDRPKESIVTWLSDNYPSMKPDRIKRLSTVANWSKAPGRAAEGEK